MKSPMTSNTQVLSPLPLFYAIYKYIEVLSICGSVLEFFVCSSMLNKIKRHLFCTFRTGMPSVTHDKVYALTFRFNNDAAITNIPFQYLRFPHRICEGFMLSVMQLHVVMQVVPVICSKRLHFREFTSEDEGNIFFNL